MWFEDWSDGPTWRLRTDVLLSNDYPLAVPSFPQVSPLSVNKPKVEVHNPQPRSHLVKAAEFGPKNVLSWSGSADHGAIDALKIR